MKRVQYLFFAGLLAFVTACTAPDINVARQSAEEVEIFPDYKDIIIPCNIAPMNFTVESEQEHRLIIRGGDSQLQVSSDSEGLFDIPIKQWRKIVGENIGRKLEFTVARLEGDEWVGYKPFTMEISPDSIDSHLAYRLLPPAEQWLKIGIFQRDLESFEQKAIFENKLTDYNCINCHSFPDRNPDKMIFHLRAKNANGTAYIENGKVTKLNTKTPETISSLVYPYWHPSERYIVVSTNLIYQSYYYHSEDRMEVYDEKSDVVVYDVEKEEIFTNDKLSSPDAMETLPTFSPDGKSLYFCTADNVEQLALNIDKLKYSLCRVDFDAETGTIGDKVDTLFNAKTDGRSISFPRISPDGKRMVVCLVRYGNWSINHKDSDLYELDLQTGELTAIDVINTEEVESYHSWSTNSRWMVFSSRRDDRLYTRPYFTYVSEDGTYHKPFLLPQRSPRKHYRNILHAYNIPELVNGEVEVNPHEIATVMAGEGVNVKFRENGAALGQSERSDEDAALPEEWRGPRNQ